MGLKRCCGVKLNQEDLAWNKHHSYFNLHFGDECSYFIAVWYVTLKNAADVLNIQSCTWFLLESHGVTQHKWQRLSITTVFHWICAKLPTKKTITSRPKVIKRCSLNSTIILSLYLCGQTSACRSWHGFAGNAAHEDGVDGVEETGFSSTYRTDH